MEKSEKRTLGGYLWLYVVGVIVGAADVIPGVSGGTMALVLGIYEELLDSIRRFASGRTVKMLASFKLKEAYRTLPWPFMAVLLLGIASASVLLAKPLTWMLTHRVSFILAFFFGLVLASIITVLMRIPKFSWRLIPGFVFGAAVGWLIVGMKMIQSPPEAWWYLVLCGAVAICAMILPGISGSFILLLMGRYVTVMAAIKNIFHRDAFLASLQTLALFTVGVVLGVASFSRLLSWMFKRWRDLTIVVLAGFMLGSLRKIWPWQDGDILKGRTVNALPRIDGGFWIAVLLAVAGFVLVMAIELLARRFERRAASKQSEGTVC